MQVIIHSALLQGLVYAFMVLGVFITFRVLDFPDLTVDGSFTLGAAVTASTILAGHDPWLATALGTPATQDQVFAALLRAALDGAADIEDLVKLPVREAIGRFKYIPEQRIEEEYKQVEKKLAEQLKEALDRKETL